MSSNVSSVTSHFPTANEGFSTTTNGVTIAGANNVVLFSVDGLTDGSIFVGVIEPSESKEQVFTGTVDVSGSKITNVVWTKGTNVEHASGVSIVDYDTGTAFNMMSKGVLVSLNQDGTLRNSSVTTNAIASSAVTNSKIADNTIAAGKLNLPHSSDAANYVVYDFGNFKLYRYRMGNTITVTNGQRGTWGTFPVPTGLAYTDVRPIGLTYEGGFAGHAVVGLEAGSSSGWTCNLGNQYIGTPLTFTGSVHLTLITV